MEGAGSSRNYLQAGVLIYANQDQVNQIQDTFGKLTPEQMSDIINKANQSGKEYLRLQLGDGSKVTMRLLNEQDSRAILQNTPKEVKEIFDAGRFVLEKMDNQGKRTAFANESVVQQMMKGQVQFKGKKGNVKQYSSIQALTKTQQSNIAKTFTKIFLGISPQQEAKITTQTTQRERPRGAGTSYKAPISTS